MFKTVHWDFQKKLQFLKTLHMDWWISIRPFKWTAVCENEMIPADATPNAYWTHNMTECFKIEFWVVSINLLLLRPQLEHFS